MKIFFLLPLLTILFSCFAQTWAGSDVGLSDGLRSSNLHNSRENDVKVFNLESVRPYPYIGKTGILDIIRENPQLNWGVKQKLMDLASKTLPFIALVATLQMKGLFRERLKGHQLQIQYIPVEIIQQQFPSYPEIRFSKNQIARAA
jgi:hypothetical protein